MKFLKKYLLLLFVLLIVEHSYGQAADMDLVKEYFKRKEFEKAQDVLNKVLKQGKEEPEFYTYYVKTLTALRDWKDLEKFLKKKIKNEPDELRSYLDYADVLFQKNELKESETIIGKVTDLSLRSDKKTQQLVTLFLERGNIDKAAVTIKAARLMSKNNTLFGDVLSNLYKNEGKIEQMIEEKLNYAESIGDLDIVKEFIQDEIIVEKDIKILENYLYQKVQNEPEKVFHAEVLIAYLTNQKAFYKAFIQARALDKRMQQQGQGVYYLALMAKQSKDWVNASKMFEYLVKEYPKAQEYPTVKRFLVGCREELIKNKYPVAMVEIEQLIKNYEELSIELGNNINAFEALKNKAQLQAFYMKDLEAAEKTLKNVIDNVRYDPSFINRCKLDLGDIQLLKNEFWDATITYQQVEKAEKDNPIGYDAKLKNAKLNYFKGDFELAEEILGILKKATSREIANDAMELNLLIRNNIEEDINMVALKNYAKADFLIFQNDYEAAIEQLNIVIVQKKENSMIDEALYQKALLHFKLGNFEKSVIDLRTILKDYAYEPVSDDAVFLLGQILEENINEPVEAMQMYQRILKEYPGSIYVVEARKRLRKLRGDDFN